MGSHCPLCGTPGHLRPYTHIQLLTDGCRHTDLKAKDPVRPTPESFKYSNLDMSQGARVHFDHFLGFCTTSTLHFFFCRARCHAVFCAR